MLSQVIANAGDKITVPIVEIDIDHDPKISVEYGVRSVPTMILIDENETELKRNVGAMNETQLLDFLKG
jgi:thioredoxin-like negative regulator of GroEL